MKTYVGDRETRETANMTEAPVVAHLWRRPDLGFKPWASVGDVRMFMDGGRLVLRWTEPTGRGDSVRSIEVEREDLPALIGFVAEGLLAVPFESDEDEEEGDG